MKYVLFACLLSVWIVSTGAASAATLLYPNLRSTYYSHEPIELAFVGLEEGELITVTLSADGVEAVSFEVTGDGSTALVTLPPYALAPATYSIRLNEEELPARQALKVARGTWTSTMLVSQTGGDGYRNFRISNAFSFGMFDREGQAASDVRARWSMGRYEDVITQEMPALIYMYWTGFVLHKPWGIHKEWASADMIENMRLFNFHVAQRMRRFDHLIYAIGSIDEPGLPWGRTAAGGSASGFTGWNVADWLEERGMAWTDDPGSLDDETFLRYIRLRGRMLGEAFEQASSDIKTVWPAAVYATDAYAPHAIADGTDPMNQRANDIPTTHVFSGWGYGHPGVLGGLYLEKADNPVRKVAHAMNGQLFGFPRVDPSVARSSYHLMQNILMAGGLDSNWWLNHREMESDDLDAVNEPAARIGPFFHKVEPSDHEVAVLWSPTELSMRLKGLMRAQASQEDGEQIALMISEMPEDAVGEDGTLKYNAYSVGNNYKGEVLTTFTAVNRAGWPAHILHEDRLAEALADYKVLVVSRQAFELPQSQRQVIEQWVAEGGTLVTHAESAVTYEGALVVDSPEVVNQGFAWGNHFTRVRNIEDPSETRDASYYQTSVFMESFSRDAAPAFAEVLAQTPARRVLEHDGVDLMIERHVGDGYALVMVINTHEALSEGTETEQHLIWNHAPLKASYRLPLMNSDDVVYRIEGTDWKTVSRVATPDAVQQGSFAAGEMKLYLVLPSVPTALVPAVTLRDGMLDISVRAPGLAAALPVTLRLQDPDGEELLYMHRSLDSRGELSETIAIGQNARSGAYTVRVESPIEALSASAQVTQQAKAASPVLLEDVVRIFDRETIAEFLKEKPDLVIAVGDAAHRPLADKLANDLSARGIQAKVQSPDDVLEKVLYPRVWDPYLTVQVPAEDTMRAFPELRKLDENNRPIRDDDGQFVMEPGTARQELLITSDFYETPTVTTLDGEPFVGNWRAPGTLLTVVGDGFILMTGAPDTFIEPGVKIFYDDANRVTYLNATREQVQSTDEVRARWAKPWSRLISYIGGHNLTPQLPEAYRAATHLVLLGDNANGGELVRALQASELLPQVVDEAYPGPGKALVQFAWSPFALEKNVIFIGGSDVEGLQAGIDALSGL